MAYERVAIMNAVRRRPDLHSRDGRSPLLVEVMGPAASGKTSLIRKLDESDDRIRTGLHVERITFVRSVVGGVIPLVPRWVLHYRYDRWFSRREIRSIAFLDAWYRTVEAKRLRETKAVLFDHGPLYRLARLHEFGPAITQSDAFRAWWRASLGRWLSTLDMVVWLDAPDPVLLQRAGERGHWYLNEVTIEEQTRFLARYRRAFAEILAPDSPDGPRVLRFESQQGSLAQIADEVLGVIRSAVPQARSEHETNAASTVHSPWGLGRGGQGGQRDGGMAGEDAQDAPAVGITELGGSAGG